MGSGSQGQNKTHLTQSQQVISDTQLLESSRILIISLHVQEGKIDDLRKGKKLPKSSHLPKLSAFIDPDGVVRVGGPFDMDRPMHEVELWNTEGEYF